MKQKWSALEIQELAAREYGATEIYRELEKKHTSGLPTFRTVQNYVARARAHRPTEGTAVSILELPAEDLVDAAPVMREVALQTRGRRVSFSVEEAHVMAQIRRISPDTPLWGVYRLAIEYLFRQEHNQSVSDIDLVLLWDQ